MIINFPLYIVLILLLISFVFVKFYILGIVSPHQPFGCQIPSTTYLSNKVYLLTTTIVLVVFNHKLSQALYIDRPNGW